MSSSSGCRPALEAAIEFQNIGRSVRDGAIGSLCIDDLRGGQDPRDLVPVEKPPASCAQPASGGGVLDEGFEERRAEASIIDRVMQDLFFAATGKARNHRQRRFREDARGGFAARTCEREEIGFREPFSECRVDKEDAGKVFSAAQSDAFRDLEFAQLPLLAGEPRAVLEIEGQQVVLEQSA